jgi:K+-sensing histidine kinase KdpD
MVRNHTSTFVLKMAFFLGAALITIASTLYASKLAKDLASEERKKMELWAEAIRLFATEPAQANGMDNSLKLSLKIIEGNANIPVVLVDDHGNLIDYKNIDLKDPNNPEELNQRVQDILHQNQVIPIQLGDKTTHYIYYQDSYLLRKLTYFPFIQLLVMFVFLAVTLFALSTSKRAEQNRVWVGLSKETAHQLGTPISSLMAWVELLKLKDIDPKLLGEMEKDTLRLQTIAERFSKIGSKSETHPQDLIPALEKALQYMRDRSSKKITFTTELPNQPALVSLNVPLFEWVIENLCKNAIDAMGTHGRISVRLTQERAHWLLDVSDTGKGITKSNFKNVFKPGYTTKARGWGLGLSLVKRIIEENHNGKIFIKSSELGKGTTFRIVLNKA